MGLSEQNAALVERNHMGRLVGPHFVTISDHDLNHLLNAARAEATAAQAARIAELEAGLITIRDMKAFGADADALDDLVRDIRAKARALLHPQQKDGRDDR